MEELNFIVSQLNKPPFSLTLTMFELDEKAPEDLLQILNDIFSSLEPEMEIDLKNEVKEARAARMMQFLIMLRCKLVPSQNSTVPNDRSTWMQELAGGNKALILPIMHWILSSYEALSKRAYLARYLVPVDLPIEVKMEENPDLQSLIEKYTCAQEKFKNVHRKYEKVETKSENDIYGSDINTEMIQLQKEKQELKEKIHSLQSQKKHDPDIDKVLISAKKLRLEQEKEIRLLGKKKEQKHLLYDSEQKISILKQKLFEFERNYSQGSSSEDLLKMVAKEVEETKKTVRTNMVSELNAQHERLAILMRERLEPTVTENDLRRLQAELNHSKKEFDELTLLLKEKGDTGIDKLILFQQHVKMSEAKITSKEKEVETMKREIDSIHREVDGIESQLNEVIAAACSKLRPKGTVISKQDVKKVREQNRQYAISREELSDLQAETVTLSMTHQTLKKRSHCIEEFLKEREQKAGLDGFRKVQTRLENDSEKASDVDDIKGQTLEEISALIKDTTSKVESKREKLEPLIKALKSKREEFRKIRQKHHDAKIRYDKMTLKFTTERQLLEKKCNDLQDKWLAEERRHHQLSAMNEITRLKGERIGMEKIWRSGKEQFLPEFQSLKDLYENKIQQQENLSKELRKKQRNIKENEESNIHQRYLFTDLLNLLQCKKEMDERNKASMMDEDQFIAGTVDIGGAQVLCLE